MQGDEFIRRMSPSLKGRIKPPAHLRLPLGIILLGATAKVVGQFEPFFH